MTKIKKPNELSKNVLLKALIYGQPGIGKSTLALSMPDPLLIDCDRGTHRIEQRFLCDTVEVSGWEDIDEVLNETLSKYKTLIFDTAGKLLEYMTASIIKNNPKLNVGGGQLSLQGYGVRKVMFQNMLARVHVMGKHIIFVAHEKEEKDGELRFVRPEIGGSSGNDLIKELDLVGYMEAIGTKRVIRFNPQEKFYAKNSMKLPDPMNIPDTANGNIFMKEIVKTYESTLTARAAKIAEYDEFIEALRVSIDQISDPNAANIFVEHIKQFDHIWDSRYQAQQMFRKKTAELGLGLNKETGKFESKPAVKSVFDIAEELKNEGKGNV